MAISNEMDNGLIKKKVKNKRVKIIVLIVTVILITIGVFSYWFLSRSFEVTFYFECRFFLEDNQTKMDVLLIIDNEDEYSLKIYNWYIMVTPHESFKTQLKYGDHNIKVYYSNKTLFAKKDVFISEDIYIITEQNSPTELYIRISEKAPGYK
ncbi:MAG: hypothetical protein JSW07_08270 [bacterium]|nr:MAG: hypothetical protein JSW07_08270 [bacterium]